MSKTDQCVKKRYHERRRQSPCADGTYPREKRDDGLSSNESTAQSKRRQHAERVSRDDDAMPRMIAK
jgi:hypothetical protein